MKKLIAVIIVIALCTLACKKKTEEEASQNTTSSSSSTTGTAPCTPTTNASNMGVQTFTYNSVTVHPSGGYMGSWALVGIGSQGDMYFDFSGPPATGNYTVTNSSLGPNDCSVYGIWGSPIPATYYAANGTTLYVKNLGGGKYNATFCSAQFSTSSNSITFTTNGNLTIP